MTSMQEVESAPTREEIERRAYQIYLEHGAQDGQDLGDWLAAEKELTQGMREPLRATKTRASATAAA